VVEAVAAAVGSVAVAVEGVVQAESAIAGKRSKNECSSWGAIMGWHPFYFVDA
jgi:hypothetical protein